MADVTVTISKPQCVSPVLLGSILMEEQRVKIAPEVCTRRAWHWEFLVVGCDVVVVVVVG